MRTQAYRSPLRFPLRTQGAFGVKRPLGHQLVDPLTGLERGVELEQRLGPEQPQAQAFLDPFGNARVADVHEAADHRARAREHG